MWGRSRLSLGGGCTLYLSGPLVTFGGVSNAHGFATLGFPVPFDPALRGFKLNLQAFTLDAQAPVLGLSFSNAVRSSVGY